MSQLERPDHSKRLPRLLIAIALVVGIPFAFLIVLEIPSLRSGITGNLTAVVIGLGAFSVAIWGTLLYRKRNTSPEFVLELLQFVFWVGCVVWLTFKVIK